MGDVVIMKVTPDDAGELLEIYKPYVLNTAITFEIEVPTVEEFRQRIVNISEKYPYIKAVKDGKILGYAYAGAFKERAAYDWSVETTIYVREEQRHRGIGRAMYSSLEKSLADMGILNANACIASPVAEDEHLNNDSEKFHKKMGYSLVGRFHASGFKFGTWYDMIWMEKILGEHGNAPAAIEFGDWKV